jgi:hypothetical protein
VNDESVAGVLPGVRGPDAVPVGGFGAPSPDHGSPFGALGLYSRRTETLDDEMLGELAALADPIAAVILAQTPSSDAQTPSSDSLSSSTWLGSDAPAARMRVWLAVASWLAAQRWITATRWLFSLATPSGTRRL